MDELKFPSIPEERKRDIIMSISQAFSKHQGEINFDLPDTVRNDAVNAYRKERERRLEYALRYLIPHPIKGEITKGKCRYRGLYIKEHELHLSTQELEERDGSYILHCRFMFPNICGRKSRSGKREAFEISLGFDLDTFVVYRAWCMKNDAIMFGFGGRSYGKRTAMYKCKGIVEQIKKENNETDSL